MAFTEPEVYKEDEVFDECSDEEGDLLIKSAFEEEEVEERVNEEENVKVKLEGTTKSKNIGTKTQELDSLQEEVKKEAEDSKEDIFNASQNFMGPAPADLPVEERLNINPADLADMIVTKEVKTEMEPVPLMLPPGPEMLPCPSSPSSPTWATIIPLIGGSALGCKEVCKEKLKWFSIFPPTGYRLSTIFPPQLFSFCGQRTAPEKAKTKTPGQIQLW